MLCAEKTAGLVRRIVSKRRNILAHRLGRASICFRAWASSRASFFSSGSAGDIPGRAPCSAGCRGRSGRGSALRGAQDDAHGRIFVRVGPVLAA